jgi:hypothetical protein
MKRRAAALLALACLAALPAALPAPASASPLAAWQLEMVPVPTDFVPASSARYKLTATNVGAAPSAGQTTIEATLPAGLTATSAAPHNNDPQAASEPSCSVAAHLVLCQSTEPVHPGRYVAVSIVVSVEAPEGALLEAGAQVFGGGALQAVSAAAPTEVSSAPAPFGVFGAAAPSTDEEGLPASAAGSHPYQLTFSMHFPSVLLDPEHLGGSGHARDAYGELPRGYLLDPAAVPLLCTEAELLSEAGCPDASQIGIASVATANLGSPSTYALNPEALYDMVPPPGTPASLGFNAAGVGIFVHLLSGVRSDSDYGLYGYSRDILALNSHPLFSTQLQFWGDPSAEAHASTRGACMVSGSRYNETTKQFEPCRVPPRTTALLSAPAACEADPPRFKARADSWEEPGLFRAAPPYSAADLAGAPAPTTGCNAEPFAPQIEARPTTDQADSPAGLEVKLTQPTDTKLEHISPAPLKDARITLPEGLLANPSQADGLAACSEAQIGYLAEDPEAGVHFSKDPQSCPEAAKLGTLEVKSPLLAQYEDSASGAGTKLVEDPETGAAIPRPLQGAVYLAKPYANPFGSLLALYLAIEDPRSGIVAKLAGKVIPDPQTGQLTTVFQESPELPLSEVEVSLFGGARASLTTPLDCGPHTTTTTLTPWSAPEGQDAHPSSSFQVAGGCSASEAAAPNSPSFEAGTLSPQAGRYSPFVVKLSRPDGSQRLRGIDTTLPPGLSGRLAGIATCSEAQLAVAKSREAPNMGQAEIDSPSCPAASEVGVVKVAAGSGPTPFWTSGHAYLAGPYHGAPLSLAAIVPAVAGPFDLGAVVTRVALHVDPATAQIHAVSDPLPQILDGIPLDLRTVILEMGRPSFTLNPTSCDPMSVTGAATSSLGNVASLTSPFQVGGCSSLKFKPKIKLRLKGATKRTGHPKLIAVLHSQGAGVANLRRVQVKLPASAFLDQAHIRTVCTRVQFAAGAGNGAACPKGSVYGRAWVKTPLFDYTLPGKVFLRSSNHKLPDLVIALQGPSNQPIAIELDGKTDSVKGALRNTFQSVPDQPFNTARVVLFGGKRGLVVNSRNLCAQSKRQSRANVRMVAQSGKVSQLHPLVRNSCKKRKGHKKKHKGHRHKGGGRR